MPDHMGLPRKGYTTPEKLVSRFIGLASVILSNLAGRCFENVVPEENGFRIVAGLISYTGYMLSIFFILGAVMHKIKESVLKGRIGELADNVLKMKPSELLAMTVDEGISHISSAIASVVIAAWFAMMPAKTGVLHFIMLFVAWSIVLCLGEMFEHSYSVRCSYDEPIGCCPGCRTCCKANTQMLIHLINGINSSSASWYLSSVLVGWLITFLKDGSRAVEYWMWLVAFLVAIILMEPVNYISARMPTRENQWGQKMIYGTYLFGLVKSIPFHISALVLCAVVQRDWENNYVLGALVWCCISSVVAISFHQLIHMRGGGCARIVSPCTFYNFKPKERPIVLKLTSEAYSIMGQSFAYVDGALAEMAMPEEGTGTFWILMALGFFFVSLLIEVFRVKALPRLFKQVAKAASECENDVALSTASFDK